MYISKIDERLRCAQLDMCGRRCNDPTRGGFISDARCEDSKLRIYLPWRKRLAYIGYAKPLAVVCVFMVLLCQW